MPDVTRGYDKCSNRTRNVGGSSADTCLSNHSRLRLKMLEIGLHTGQPVFRRRRFSRLQANIARNSVGHYWKRKIQRGQRQGVGHTGDLSAEVAARFFISDLLAIQAPAGKRVTVAANLLSR